MRLAYKEANALRGGTFKIRQTMAKERVISSKMAMTVRMTEKKKLRRVTARGKESLSTGKRREGFARLTEDTSI